jgi:hypothetical protein
MEIGQKTTQKISKSGFNINKFSLAIHVNFNWIVFCLFDNYSLKEVNKISFLKKNKPSYLLKCVKKFIKTFSKNELPNKVKIIYYTGTSTLVPSALFDKKNSLNYLKYNSSIKLNDISANDNILNDEINNLYIPDLEINNFIFDKFKAFDFFHYSSLIIDRFSNELIDKYSENLFLNINDNFVDILYFKDNKLIFYNAFDYESPEDILYYLLFCLSQLNLDVEKTHVLCYGDINLDYKLYNLLYTYIRNIELIDSEEVDGVDNNILRSNILLSKF